MARLTLIRRLLRPTGVLLTALVLAGSPTSGSAQATSDPLQPFNRAMFTFNDAVDRALLRPLAIGYRAVLPQQMRNGVNNFFNNLRAPTTLLNDLLQGKPKRAQQTINRFVKKAFRSSWHHWLYRPIEGCSWQLKAEADRDQSHLSSHIGPNSNRELLRKESMGADLQPELCFVISRHVVMAVRVKNVGPVVVVVIGSQHPCNSPGE